MAGFPRLRLNPFSPGWGIREAKIAGVPMTRPGTRAAVTRALLPATGERPGVSALQGGVGELAEIPAALSQGSLARPERFFIRTVFHFDADGAAVIRLCQEGKEAAPVDVPKAGQLGSVKLKRRSQNPHVV